jgi:AcrR family transcriptional regulator
MNSQPTKSSNPVGRPRAFDKEQALEKALHLFWTKGYEGTSLTDLTHAMDINRPSLYAAFGNKEDLFKQALNRYLSGPASYINEAVKEPTARRVVEQFLKKSAELLTNPNNPNGCLVIQGALSCSSASDNMRQELIACRKAYETTIRQRLERAKSEGDLPADADPAELAQFVATVHQGMAVQAASGTGYEELLKIINTALKSWPS